MDPYLWSTEPASWIRISGVRNQIYTVSCSFFNLITRCEKNKFFVYFLLYMLHLRQSSKVIVLSMKIFVIFMLIDGRIQFWIRTDNYGSGFGGLKLTDPSDQDPENWYLGTGTVPVPYHSVLFYV